jgi:hypothetical protein
VTKDLQNLVKGQQTCDFGYESSRIELGSWVWRKVAYMQRRMEFICAFKEIDFTHNKIKIDA